MSSSHISVRGARQHNLKNVDVDIPHHRLTVVTGLSGSGKSSLAFDTLYAEGQRRYVETFSPYTRQFLERMDKPDVDRIDGLPPAIAIEQSNSVKTSRSTVGTMTEIADHLKLLFARLASLTCPHCGRQVRPLGATQITDRVLEARAGSEALIGFSLSLPNRPSLAATLATLKQQGFLRVVIDGELRRTDDPVPEKETAPPVLRVVQDRVVVAAKNRARLAEAVESALRHGQGQVQVFEEKEEGRSEKLEGKAGSVLHPSAFSLPTFPNELRFSSAWICPYDGAAFREPSPALFSFNNPQGACPACRGFGRTIEIDYERALPDRNLSIRDGVVKPWQSGVSLECQRDLLKHCAKRGIPLDKPFCELKPWMQKYVIEGELREGATPDELWEAGGWYGVKGYFRWLETKAYKMHVRVFLSRYRVYKTCPVCHGARFQPEALQWKLEGRRKKEEVKAGGSADEVVLPSHFSLPPSSLTLPEINRLPLTQARDFFESLPLPTDDDAAEQLRDGILARLTYLIEVGLGYLTLDRATRTLSGGEIQRVNLTSCLGNSLVNTLFVLDEPSIGLHPRDMGQLVGVMKRLRDRGNTVLVVEHEEAVMREADHLLELGPGRGAEGGNVVFAGDFRKMLGDRNSLTGAYLNETKTIPLPEKRRAPDPAFQLRLLGASANNLRDIDVTVPLGMFVGVSGVSGSGKSTLVHQVLHPALLAARHVRSENEEACAWRGLLGADFISEVVRVDQSPLSRTPRSNAALYLGAYDFIRDLFAGTDAARSQGYAAGDFSFNGGTGRCPRCNGSGAEKIEMQFLADVFVTCPVCEGRRFQAPLLQVRYRGRSVHEVLEMTVDEARNHFDPGADGLGNAERRLHERIGAKLGLLAEVGLGYLRLGQPLNQLSGGEAQRIKLLRYLSDEDGGRRTPCDGPSRGPATATLKTRTTRLFILDEPTTGLHFEDIRLLLAVLQRLVDQGDSLVVIEHNLEVLKCADWIIDLGPEAEREGGRIVAAGTPETIAATAASHTGKFLRPKLAPRKAGARVREESNGYGNARALRSLDAMPKAIQIRGARHHNLKNISLDIALNEMTVVTGLSGSGKSTLAFDLLFAEGQRRYLDSLNAYARQFVEQLERPDVDSITGIPPSVAIEQRVTRGGRKSTVATVTEIFQFVRLLYAKLGRARDPETGEPAIRQTPAEILARLEEAARGRELRVLAPLIKGRKGFHTEVARWAEKKGHPLLRVDGKWIEPAKFKALDRYVEHTISVELGRFHKKRPAADRRRLVDAALALGRGTLYALDPRGRETVYSTQLFCPGTGRSFDELEPRLFSFNSPHGWCPACQGFGTLFKVRTEGETEAEREIEIERAREWAEDDGPLPVCPECRGRRLNPLARAVRLPLGRGAEKHGGLTIGEIGELSIIEALRFFRTVKPKGREARIARDILPEIVQRLAFLVEVGLGYLSLDRSATTLSGGESQRIRLAAQFGSELQGVLYVLDEPTIGLHPRDNARLLDSLATLRDRGNTLVVVEHDEDTMRFADRIIDLGPGAGAQGGEIIAEGSWRALAKRGGSPTGKILGRPLRHPLRGERRSAKDAPGWCRIRGANANNLKRLDVRFPAGRFIALCGVSGAGKSTLLHDVIKPAAQAFAGRLRGRSRRGKAPAGPWKKLEGFDVFTSVYEVDQAPIGKTSRSTPATYIGLMDEIRALFARLPLARQCGYEASRFSFNSGSGRCPACLGQGAVKVEMSFLPSTFVPCETCRGRRYNPETLEVRYNEKSIADTLDLTIDQAVDFFADVPRLHRPLALLRDTGLGYLTLGQRSPTLSGGEAQRIKLVAELARSLEMNAQKRLKTRGFAGLHHLYLLEEPTIGLHLADVQRLLHVLHRLVDAGHTVIVIEHHLDVLADADYLIELGPEGGDAGGELVAQGTPEEIAKAKHSATAPFLARIFSRN
ncbi:MAG TPA: excinuclease ABC subunit UvrA [Candidatus Methylacidiphilales bacterium]|jgi:excinuclease ABC subunit A|nr:excinuclease ABC subunit UvrA [Candidatus Methylacidiphilales bacterium]